MKIQSDSMRRRSINEDLIRRELQCMERAIRSRLPWPHAGDAP
jgi:hypothetical protein